MPHKQKQIKREVHSTKDGFKVKEIFSCGKENWIGPMNRAEIKSHIVSFGLCEHIAEKIISDSKNYVKLLQK